QLSYQPRKITCPILPPSCRSNSTPICMGLPQVVCQPQKRRMPLFLRNLPTMGCDFTASHSQNPH
ncbi:MAG: hypothetical protein RBS57_16680, partial [Desulforhabdus sp.]|nr:hypothetical protein [Desulforhabdus sp.]